VFSRKVNVAKKLTITLYPLRGKRLLKPSNLAKFTEKQYKYCVAKLRQVGITNGELNLFNSSTSALIACLFHSSISNSVISRLNKISKYEKGGSIKKGAIFGDNIRQY
jgi:hypothetical protein